MRGCDLRRMPIIGMALCCGALLLMVGCDTRRSCMDSQVEAAYHDIQGEWPLTQRQLSTIYHLLWQSAYKEARLRGEGEDVAAIRRQADQAFKEFCEAAERLRRDYLKKQAEGHLERLRRLTEETPPAARIPFSSNNLKKGVVAPGTMTGSEAEKKAKDDAVDGEKRGD